MGLTIMKLDGLVLNNATAQRWIPECGAAICPFVNGNHSPWLLGLTPTARLRAVKTPLARLAL